MYFWCDKSENDEFESDKFTLDYQINGQIK